MARYIGQGHKGDSLRLTLVPSAALKTMLDTAWATDNTVITGWKVAFTYLNNNEVSHAAAHAYYDGVIEKCEKCNGSPYYRLSVDVLTYKDGSGNVHTARELRHEPYSVVPALHDGLVAATTSSYNVRGSSAGGGSVIAIDEPASGYCDALF